jgi:type IV pilus assembly protein PilM
VFFGGTDALVGLDIGSGAIKVLQLKEIKGKYKVDRFGMKSLPPETIVDGAIMDSLEVVTAIKALIAEQKIKNKNVALSISGTSVIVKKISLPPMSDEELERQIKFEAEQYIPFDINDVFLDYHKLTQEGETEGQQEMPILLVASKKDKLNDYANVVRQAGLDPKIVDVDAFAIENMYCINYETVPDELTALVNIGATVTNINILSGSTSVFTRDCTIGGNRYTESIQQNLGLTLEDAEAAKRGQLSGVDEAGLSAAVGAVDVEVATEISRSFDYFRTTATHEAEIARIVLSGGCAKIPTLPARITEQIGIETSLADPFKNLDTSGLKMTTEELSEAAPAAAVVVGLAIRREGDR